MYCHFRQKFWKSIEKNSFKLYHTEHCRTDPLLTFCTRLYTSQLLSDVTGNGQIEHNVFRIKLVDLFVTCTYIGTHKRAGVFI